ncbi:hypothetical protein [Nocardiopsis coralliicola]
MTSAFGLRRRAAAWTPVRLAPPTAAVPVQVGAVLAVLAAVWFAGGDLRGAIAGSALLGAVLAADAVRDHSVPDAYSGWLATALGRLREYAVYAGLAVGGTASGVEDAWAWGAGALIAHALRDTAATAPEPLRSSGSTRRARSGARPAAALAPGPLRAAAAFPVPLRFAVIAVTAVTADARVTFIALITGCSVAVAAALADPRPGATER